MYDVQPVNPEDWDSPPFDAELIDHELGKVIMARGATNQKGPERAFLTARLGLPLVPAGMGFGTGAHAPNEIMLIEPAEGIGAAGLADIEKAYVDFVYALAD